MQLRPHLLYVVEPVHVRVGRQVDTNAAALQAPPGGTQLQQPLDILGWQLGRLQHVCHPYLHPNLSSRRTLVVAISGNILGYSRFAMSGGACRPLQLPLQAQSEIGPYSSCSHFQALLGYVGNTRSCDACSYRYSCS